MKKVKNILILTLLISSVLNLHMQLFEFELSKNYFFYFVVSLPLIFFLIKKNYGRLLIHSIEKKSKFFLILLIVYGVVILYRAGLFNEGPIIQQDYPIHYFVGWFLTSTLLPIFKNTIGLCINFQLGYTALFDYQIGLPLSIAGLYNLFFGKVPLWMIFRFMVGLGFILPIIAVYSFTRKLKFPPVVSLLSSLFWLSWSHVTFISGMFTSYFSLSFSILMLYFYITFSESKKLSSLFLCPLFMTLTLLFHSLIFLLAFLCFCIYTIMNYKELGITPFLSISVMTILMGLLYFVSVYNGMAYINYNLSRGAEIVFPHVYDLPGIFHRDFYRQSSFIILFTLPLILLTDYKKVNKYCPFLVTMTLFLFVMVFLINFTHTRNLLHGLFRIIVNVFLIDRVIFFSRIFFGILASYVIYVAFTVLNSKRVHICLLLSLISALLILSVLPFVNYFWDAWHRSDSSHFGFVYDDHTFEEVYSFNFSNGALAHAPREDVVEVFDFLRENTTNDARILVEDSRYGKLGGNIMAMAPYYTGRMFVNGVYVGMVLPGNDVAFDGIVFGKNITDYTIEEFKEKLDEFNVGWIVVWTPTFTGYLESYPKNFELLKTTQSGLLRIYEYKDSPKNYIESFDTSVKAKLINFTNNTIIVGIKNSMGGDKLLLKFRYEKDWHAYVNKTEIPVEPKGILMSVNLPFKGDYNIVFKYEENFLAKTGKYVSLFSFIITVIAIVYLKFKEIMHSKSKIES